MHFSRKWRIKTQQLLKPWAALEGKVQGLEHEYAIEFKEIDNKEDRDKYIVQKILGIKTLQPVWDDKRYISGACWRNLSNGGLFYIDLGHLEGCTPECPTTRELLKQDRAMDLLALRLFGKDKNPIIYKINRDESTSFGAHQNFSVRFKPNEKTIEPLLLWEVVEKVITGAGYQYPDGQYEISQRRTFLRQAFSLDTRDIDKGGGLLNTRDESLTKLHGWHRFHNISNDANMNQSALAMKQELMQCVLALHEIDLLPKIPYYHGEQADLAVKDLDRVCCQHQDWMLEGTPQEFRSVTAVLREYEKVIRGEFYGHSFFRNLIIDLFKDTIAKLERIKDDPYALAGRIDWVTKKYVIEHCMGSERIGCDHPRIQSINLDYHRIDSKGLFYQTRADGWIEQHVSDKEAEAAIVLPPRTRAETRGRLVQKYGEGVFKDGSRLWLYWDDVTVTNAQDCVIWRRSLGDHRFPDNKILEDLETFLKWKKCI